jgi:hypothetical protein
MICSLFVLQVKTLTHRANWAGDPVLRPDMFLAKDSQVSVFLHVRVSDRVPAVPSVAL